MGTDCVFYTWEQMVYIINENNFTFEKYFKPRGARSSPASVMEHRPTNVREPERGGHDITGQAGRFDEHYSKLRGWVWTYLWMLSQSPFLK